jgi:DnaJ-class molecular chaperone
MTKLLDYYEVMQINRNADLETVHRVYHFMAARFHPDNRKTGDLERFLELGQAYQVLSDPARRAQYDATSAATDSEPMEIFELQDFIDGYEGEINRRLGVLGSALDSVPPPP